MKKIKFYRIVLSNYRYKVKRSKICFVCLLVSLSVVFSCKNPADLSVLGT